MNAVRYEEYEEKGKYKQRLIAIICDLVNLFAFEIHQADWMPFTHVTTDYKLTFRQSPLCANHFSSIRSPCTCPALYKKNKHFILCDNAIKSLDKVIRAQLFAWKTLPIELFGCASIRQLIKRGRILISSTERMPKACAAMLLSSD